MQCISSLRHHAQSLTAALLFLFCATAAYGADTYSGGVLTMPSLAIGSATYSNVVINPITLNDVLAYTLGGTPSGSGDSYDPGTAQLTIPTITVGNTTYTDVIVSIPSMASISISSVSGADTFDGTNLHISYVQDGGVVYKNVVVAEALGDVVLPIAGGMPTFVPDTYSSATNMLAIPAVQVGNRVYTNVVVTAGKLMSLGGIYLTITESQLYTFSSSGNTDGDGPDGALIQATDGNFYGATELGGANGGGTVFKITSSGMLTTLHSFCSQAGCTDGQSPQAPFIQATDGNIYGVAGGGAYGEGMVFKITYGGTLTTLYSFCSHGNDYCPDGIGPNAALIQATDGNFYGTTAHGGAGANIAGYAGGTVFKITPSGTLTTLYSFCSQTDCTDGAGPAALIQATDGNFYGTTAGGGAPNEGTVFKITPVGTLTTLHSFCSQTDCTDGNVPRAPLIQANDGNLYGTTEDGGANGDGMVFKITPGGTLTTLYNFCSQTGCTDGGHPVAALIQATDGNFYGTTDGGGAYGGGTAFKMTPGGTLTTLHSFCSQGNDYCPDGFALTAALIQATDGNFYGVTDGGANENGTVFRLSEGLSPFVETRTTFGKVGTTARILGD
jgi:uncharacterized repeat protein (TIGR03803 family)